MEEAGKWRKIQKTCNAVCRREEKETDTIQVPFLFLLPLYVMATRNGSSYIFFILIAAAALCCSTDSSILSGLHGSGTVHADINSTVPAVNGISQSPSISEDGCHGKISGESGEKAPPFKSPLRKKARTANTLAGITESCTAIRHDCTDTCLQSDIFGNISRTTDLHSLYCVFLI